MNTANTQTSLFLSLSLSLSLSQLDAFLSVAWWGFFCIIRVQMTSTYLLCPIPLHLQVYFALALITQ